jgi:hypothetical protein
MPCLQKKLKIKFHGNPSSSSQVSIHRQTTDMVQLIGTIWHLFIGNVTKTNDIYIDHFLLLTVPFQTHEISTSGLLEHYISYS